MTDRLTTQMIDYYRQRAPIYDQSMGYTDTRRWQQHAELVAFLRETLTDRDVLEIACGPGHWTQAVASAARSIVATDVNEAVLAEARKKHYHPAQVTFRRADAYSLAHLQGHFNGAFAVDWWSHVPKSRVKRFVRGVNQQLATGAKVVFIDQLPREAADRRFIGYDSEGNQIQVRWLPSGQSFEVIKNFPSQAELFSVLNTFSEDVEYLVHEPTRRWVLTYTVT